MSGMERVKDIDVDRIIGFKDLLLSYVDAGGFMCRHVGEAYKLIEEMFFNEDYTVFISFPADIVASGLRGVLKKIIEMRWVDIVITTCGTWDHDIARTFREYYKGDFYIDDLELRRRDMHRLGNILIPLESYGLVIEEKMRGLLEKLYNDGIKELSTYELSWHIGRTLDESSILYWAYKNEVPVVVPGPYDGAVGSQIWLFQQMHSDFRLNLYRDESLISEYVYNAKKTGGLIIGGGISKHHLLWWNQFRGGLDIAVQITTGVELDGSLTGARLSEAVTWGKVRQEGMEVSVWGEATIILPIIIKALLE
jgi:deoxyhypusine synthase